MSNTVLLVVVAFVPAAWAVIVSARSRQWLEAIGYFVLWALTAVGLGLTEVASAERLQRTLIGAAFLVALPLMWVNLKRRWRDLRP